MILEILNRHWSSRFDFFYLPIDFKNKCNLGYAFVNFTEPKYTARAYDMMHNKRWQEFNSQKVRRSRPLPRPLGFFQAAA